MNKQKILEKALLKAHRNGWSPLQRADWRNVEIQQWQGNQFIGIAFLYGQKGVDVSWVRELEGIIFNHDFARAMWGDNPITVAHFDIMPNNTNLYNWQYHLQQMILADDPIKYLGANI